jgi:hypothetical protein
MHICCFSATLAAAVLTHAMHCRTRHVHCYYPHLQQPPACSHARPVDRMRYDQRGTAAPLIASMGWGSMRQRLLYRWYPCADCICAWCHALLQGPWGTQCANHVKRVRFHCTSSSLLRAKQKIAALMVVVDGSWGHPWLWVSCQGSDSHNLKRPAKCSSSFCSCQPQHVGVIACEAVCFGNLQPLHVFVLYC